MIYDIRKASLLKRASALLLDVILLVVLACGFGMVISAVTGFDGYSDQLQQIRIRYEKQYNISFDDFDDDMTEQEQQIYRQVDEALQKDPEYIQCLNMIFSLSLVIISLGLLLSFLVLEFGVPLLLKNGQTIGKKSFGIGVVRADGVQISTFILFTRTLLGKYTMETMFPLLILMMMVLGVIGIIGPVLLLAMLVVQVVLMLRSRTWSCIHDHLACTVVVDMASQMIFRTSEELVAYRQRVQAEQAAVKHD